MLKPFVSREFMRPGICSAIVPIIFPDDSSRAAIGLQTLQNLSALPTTIWAVAAICMPNLTIPAPVFFIQRPTALKACPTFLNACANFCRTLKWWAGGLGPLGLATPDGPLAACDVEGRGADDLCPPFRGKRKFTSASYPILGRHFSSMFDSKSRRESDLSGLESRLGTGDPATRIASRPEER